MRMILEELQSDNQIIFIVFISNFNYKDKKIEEMEGQYIIPISRQDGKRFKLEIKHKNANAKKRKVKTWSA